MITREELGSLFGDHRKYHSERQIDSFIVARSGLTPYGRYRQSLRELWSRYSSLWSAWRELQELQIDLEEAEARAEFESDFDRRRHVLKVQDLRVRKDSKVFAVREISREFARFLAHARAWKEQVGELTDERRRVLDDEFWRETFRNMAGLDVVQSGAVSRKCWALVSTLPKRERLPLLAELQNTAQLRNYIVSREMPELPSEPTFKVPTMEEIRSICDGGKVVPGAGNLVELLSEERRQAR